MKTIKREKITKKTASELAKKYGVDEIILITTTKKGIHVCAEATGLTLLMAARALAEEII